jgi:hypothetical protein
MRRCQRYLDLSLDVLGQEVAAGHFGIVIATDGPRLAVRIEF